MVVLTPGTPDGDSRSLGAASWLCHSDSGGRCVPARIKLFIESSDQVASRFQANLLKGSSTGVSAIALR